MKLMVGSVIVVILTLATALVNGAPDLRGAATARLAKRSLFGIAPSHLFGRGMDASSMRRFSAQQSAECVVRRNEQLAALNTQCQTATAEDDLDHLVLFPINTTSSIAAIDRTCNPTCRAAWQAMAGALRSCFPPTTGLGNLLAEINNYLSMCDVVNGETCALHFKKYGTMTNCEDQRTASQCNAQHGFCWWGQTNASGAGCNVVHATSTYTGLCPCFSRLRQAIRALFLESETPSRSSLTRSWQMVEVALCAQVNNVYCFPRYITPQLYQLIGVEYSSLGLDAIDTGLNDMCGTSAGRACIAKLVQSGRAMALYAAGDGLKRCDTGCRTSDAVAASSCYTDCANKYYADAREGYERNYDAVCGRNAGGTRCMRHWHDIHRDPCNASIVAGTCSASCGQTFASKTVAAGCCVPIIEVGWRNEIPEYAMPQGVSNFLPSAVVSRPKTYAASQINAMATTCSNAQANWAGTNAANVAATWSTCPRATGESRTLELSALLWSSVQADHRRQQLVEMLKLDVGLASGVPSEAVINATVTNAATGTGVTFEFALVADSSIAAEEATMAYDAAVASGNLGLWSVASFIASDCTTCVTGDASQVQGNTIIATSSAAAGSVSLLVALSVVVFMAASSL